MSAPDPAGTIIAIATTIAAAASAVAALGSLLVARRSWEALRRQVRAYVELDDVLFSGVQPAQPMTCEITLRNGGQTPARDLTASISMALHSPGAPLMVNSENEETSYRSLLPGRDTLLATQQATAITPGQLRALQAGEAVVDVWGDFTYSDVFGEKHTGTYWLRCPGQKGGSLDVIAVRHSPGAFPVRPAAGVTPNH